MRKVMLVTTAFPPNLGGVETYLGHLSVSLSQHDCDVTVLRQDEPASGPRASMLLVRSRYHVDGAAQGALSAFDTLVRREPHSPRRIGSITVLRAPRWRFLPVLRSLLRSPQQRPDVVHVHAYSRPLFAQTVLACHGVPIIFTPHGGFMSPPFRPSLSTRMTMQLFDRTIAHVLMHRVAQVVALTDAQRTLLIRRYHMPAERVECLPLFVPPEARHVAHREQGSSGRFLILSRVAREKRINDLVQALDQDPDLPGCDVVGPAGDAWQEITSAAERMGEDRLRLLGAVYGNERLAFLRAAKALVLPSEWEGQSMAALEAVAQGTPLVVSTGAAHGLPPGTFLTYPTGDVAALRRCLREVSTSLVSGRLAGAAAKAAGSLPTLETHTRRLMELYSKAVASQECINLAPPA